MPAQAKSRTPRAGASRRKPAQTIAPARDNGPATREEAAVALKDVLSEHPQSAAALRRRLNVNGDGNGKDVVTDGLRVLQARHQAKRIPNTAQSKLGGWVRYDSAHEAALAEPQDMEFPYRFEVVEFDTTFIDPTYQRPLTTFARRIEKNFDPVLFGTVTLNERRAKDLPKGLPDGRTRATIDGQTRITAATALGVQRGPAVIFMHLSPQEEAKIFWKLQKERRGMLSLHRFKAQVASGDQESLEIVALAGSVGITIGEKPGEMRAPGALEACYRTDSFQLERTLVDLKSAWPERVPEGRFIRGLHFFFRHYPLDQRVKKEVDDERLVKRLRVSGPDGLIRKASAAKESSLKGRSNEFFMAQAIQNAYLSGGK